MTWITIGISGSIAALTLILSYLQARRQFRGERDRIHDEVRKELVHQRIAPYAALMERVEPLSFTHELALRQNRSTVRDLANAYHEALYGTVGVIASNLTRELIVNARAGCFNYADMKITVDELRLRIWAVHQALRSDLGLDQPNWPNETEARRAGLLPTSSGAVEERIRSAVHLVYDLYDTTIAEVELGANGPRCRGLILDMDGLMLDTERLERNVWQKAAADFGCSISDPEFFQLVGKTEGDTETILRRIWRDKGEPVDMSDAIRERKELYIDGEPIVPKEGVNELLRRARELRLPVAVASSSKRTKVIFRLSASGLIDAGPEIIVGGDEVVRGKPSPDIFLLAARRLNIDTKYCLVLEDSDSGIGAANAARMHTILVPDVAIRGADPSPEIVKMADVTCSSLLEVVPLLRRVDKLAPSP